MRSLRFFLLAASIGATPVVANAQDASWNTPYGSNGNENAAWNAPIRDGNGNLEIVNGIIQTGSGTASTLTTSDVQAGGGVGAAVGAASATAFGNQLNVVTSGKFNTVIVNSKQINNGDVIAAAGAQIGPDGGNND